MQFVLYNPSFFQKAECTAEVGLEEETKEYFLGEVGHRLRHKYVVPFEMPTGESSIRLMPKCSFR